MQKELGTAEDAVVDDSVIDTLPGLCQKLRDSGFELTGIVRFLRMSVGAEYDLNNK